MYSTPRGGRRPHGNLVKLSINKIFCCITLEHARTGKITEMMGLFTAKFVSETHKYGTCKRVKSLGGLMVP